MQKRKQAACRTLRRNNSLAELIGIILGDGNLYRHARTQNLRIICNSNDQRYIAHIVHLVSRVFHKEPSAIKRKNKQAVNINLYQREICERLELPSGNKIANNIAVPSWITGKKKYVINCLKGLFETDGCFVVDRDNYTQIIEFKNNCDRLRRDVLQSLIMLGFHPQAGYNYVRLAKKKEVSAFKDLIAFREY